VQTPLANRASRRANRINQLRLPKDKSENEPQIRRLGYARVSTYGQTLDAQLEQLRAAGCANRNIYRVKVTGAHSDRRELLKMLKALARRASPIYRCGAAIETVQTFKYSRGPCRPKNTGIDCPPPCFIFASVASISQRLRRIFPNAGSATVQSH
jgi:hypothetical protein